MMSDAANDSSAERKYIIDLLRIPSEVLNSTEDGLCDVHAENDFQLRVVHYIPGPTVTRKPNHFLALPPELAVAIIRHIPYVHRLNLALTCKHIARISIDHGLLSVNLDPAGSLTRKFKNSKELVAAFVLRKHIYYEIFQSLPVEVFQRCKRMKDGFDENLQNGLIGKQLVKHGFSETKGMHYLIRIVGKTMADPHNTVRM